MSARLVGGKYMVYKLSLNVSSLDEFPKDMSRYQIGVDIGEYITIYFTGINDVYLWIEISNLFVILAKNPMKANQSSANI